MALGAFGAHVLKAYLENGGTTHVWEKAVLYQLVHSVAILAVATNFAANSAVSPWLGRAAGFWTVGVLFFSGSLYGLALHGPQWLGPITPLGGVAFLVGWGCLAFSGRNVDDSRRMP